MRIALLLIALASCGCLAASESTSDESSLVVPDRALHVREPVLPPSFEQRDGDAGAAPDCPSALPTEGDACSVDGVFCGYSSACGLVIASCAEGAWSIASCGVPDGG